MLRGVGGAWIALGLLAQLIFSARFVVQWIASERAKESVVPLSFWYLSLVGAVLLLAYAIHRRDPVFILGQSTGSFIYLRNLQLRGRRDPRFRPPAELAPGAEAATLAAGEPVEPG
jgi:lipid-A-disaccharide synthase-like uncharacterized protein